MERKNFDLQDQGQLGNQNVDKKLSSPCVMSFLLHVTGPDLDQQFALDPSGAELTFGRDAAAGVQLADPDKHISRKHLAVRHGDGGVELRIT